MKHSKQVPLMLLGAVTALAGCGKSDVPNIADQNTYASEADCRKDWGNGDWCKNTSSGSGGGGSRGGGVVGPRYYWDRSAGRPMVIENGTARAVTSGEASHGAPSHAIATRSVATHAGGVSRGGFGATAHGGSGGG